MPVPEKLLQICEPRFLYPSQGLPISAMEDKIEALELALGMCNNDKELIRAASSRGATTQP